MSNPSKPKKSKMSLNSIHEHSWTTEFDKELQRKIDRCVGCDVTRYHPLGVPDFIDKRTK